LVGDLVERLVETDNLPVELGEIDSGLAPESDEERLASPFGLSLSSSVIGMPAAALRIRPLRKACRRE
jgi:hypothetical protein